MNIAKSVSSFSGLVQRFFCDRLVEQQSVSPRTVAAYRDSFRLLLSFLAKHYRKSPESLAVPDLNAPVILAFLNHLEKERKNSVRTRNARLAAIRSFLKYAAALDPENLAIAQRVLAIPMKRFRRPMLGYLSRQEVEAILESPDLTTWSGQRDRMMFALMYNTGVRVSELVSLRVGDVSLTSSAAVRIQGKGRKERSVPLWKQTAKRLKEWLRRLDGNPQSPLFANARGNQLSRAGVESRLRKAVFAATARCRSLAKRQVSPHTLRHTTAMHLLESGVEMTVIALWLGHESTTTTHQYVEASLAMKEKALAKLKEVPTKSNRFAPSDSLLRFLNTL